MAGINKRDREQAIREQLLADVKEDFFTILSITGNVKSALLYAGIPQSSHRQLLVTSDEYRNKLLEAKASHRIKYYVNVMDEGYHRAVEGETEKYYDKDGNVIREKRVYSDSLLKFLMEQIPGMKRTTGNDGVGEGEGGTGDMHGLNDHVENGDKVDRMDIMRNLSDEQLEQLEAIGKDLEEKLK